MSWLPELLVGPGVNFNSGRRGKTAVLSEGAGIQGAAASDRGGHGPNCGQRVQHQRRLSRVRRAGIRLEPLDRRAQREGARGDDCGLAAHVLAALHPDRVRVFERSRSLDPLDAVSLEQERNAFICFTTAAFHAFTFANSRCKPSSLTPSFSNISSACSARMPSAPTPMWECSRCEGTCRPVSLRSSLVLCWMDTVESHEDARKRIPSSGCLL